MLQECISVECVPPEAVAVCWGGGMSQCMLGYTTPGVGLETPTQARPLNFPPRCGPGDPPGQTLNFPHGCGSGDPRPLNFPPPRVWAWRPPRPDPSTSPLDMCLETYKAFLDTTPPHVNRMTDRHV